LCCSASEIKPVPLPDTKKISPSAGGQILYLEFTIKKKNVLKPLKIMKTCVLDTFYGKKLPPLVGNPPPLQVCEKTNPTDK